MPSPSPASEFAIGIEAPYAEAAAPTEVVPRVVFSIEVVAPTEVTPEVASFVGTTLSRDAMQITLLLTSLHTDLSLIIEAIRVASISIVLLSEAVTSSLPSMDLKLIILLMTSVRRQGLLQLSRILHQYGYKRKVLYFLSLKSLYCRHRKLFHIEE